MASVQRSKWARSLLPLALGGCVIAGCGRGKTTAAGDVARVRAALETYADIAHATYADAEAGARALRASVQELTATPSAAALEKARQSWIAARVPYRQSEVFRFYGGPIDAHELLLNTWPIDENYVESGDPSAPGIIEGSAQYPELSVELLRTLNARDGETSISTGYHVVELLLWGRDTSATGPGQRPFTDYVAEGQGASAYAARRGRYLTLASELMVEQLSALKAAWEPQHAGNYRERFLAMEPRAALASCVRGMGVLSGAELAGERLTVPYETRDQENEHSCFSDTTHDDVVGNAQGVQNVCRGEYVRAAGGQVRGTGVCAAIQSFDPALAEKLTAEVEASVRAARRIPAPFDRALGERDDGAGRRAIWDTIQALTRQAETLGRVAPALGLGAGGVEAQP